MYKPKLKYIFCLMRERSLMPAMSVIRYMNSVGIIPQVLMGESVVIKKELDLYKVRYEEITKLPDYDIMFSEANGHIPFEIKWLTESKRRGKINIMLINSASIYRNLVISSFLPDKTKLLDGICIKLEETVLHYKEFTKDLFLINVGDPDWDWWQSNEFKGKVASIKSEFNNKILVLCESFICGEVLSYIRLCIRKAEALNFKVFINIHPDRWGHAPEEFRKYYNTNIHHHILFGAASHSINDVGSSTVAENLFLGTKTGCNLTVPHGGGWGNNKWFTQDEWFTLIPKHVKQEIIDTLFLVFDEEKLDNFLSDSESKVSIESAGEVFGRVRVPCYTEYLFKTLDERLKK